MNFSTNQVRQFYVLGEAPVSAEGIVVKHVGTGLKQLIIDGTPTDLIDPAKITHIETSLASELAVYNKKITNVKVASPEVGKFYTFKVLIYNLYGAGDETSMPIVASAEYKTDAAFYQALAKDLNMSVKNYKALKFTGAASGLTIETTVEDYNEGFDAATSPIKEVKVDLLLDETVWTVDNLAENAHLYEQWTKDTQALPSGAKLAELEWFCMGERADQYRMMGYPNIIKTKYKIDPTKEYDVVDICYFYSDNKEGVQRSEKVITVAIPANEGAGAKLIVEALNGTAEMTAGTTNSDKDFLDEE
jgi:hypothetical protein